MIIGREIKRLILILTLLLQYGFSISQDFLWWNNKHNWDGITHWHKYITISPAFMGPNALPVPDIKNGLLLKKSNVKIALESHYSEGDKTENIFTSLYIPLFSNKVGLNVWVVPVEYYKMNVKTRDLRKARDFDGEGVSVGDFYIGTYIQIVEDKKNFPDLVLTINLKTASGTNLAAARFTDTPAYFFDLSAGKKIKLNYSILKYFRPYAMVGFYVWQTFGDGSYQNDSFLYGLGFDLNFSKVELKNSFGGYIGYIGNGDKPMIYRLALKSKFNSALNYELQFQQGINDFNYTTIRIACNIEIGNVETTPKSRFYRN